MHFFNNIKDYHSSINPDIEYLILTSSGGAGHLSAAANEQHKYPTNKSLIINVIEEGWLNFDWIQKRDYFHVLQYSSHLQSLLTRQFGKDKIEEWNNAQKNGDLDALNKMIKSQHLSNIVFGKNFADKMNELLARYPNIKKVISTQPIGLAEIHKTIARFNHSKRANDTAIEFTIVMTDLPTKYAKNFLDPIREIDQKKFYLCKLNLVVPYPATNNASNLEEYHEVFSNLCPVYIKKSTIPKYNVDVNFTIGPIDNVFIETNKLIKENGAAFVKEQYKNRPISIKFTTSAFSHLDQLPHLRELLIDDANAINNDSVNKLLNIPANAQVKSLMLGSQASLQGTLDVIDFEFTLDRNNQVTPTYLFVFCGNDTSNQSLFAKVCEKAKKYYNNGNFIVIPLTNQNKSMINHVYTIADLAITRPGGMSIMELEAAATGNVVIFAEINKKFTMKQLLQDPSLTFIIWEKGNAEHLKAKLGDQRVCTLNAYSYINERKQQLLGNTASVSNYANVLLFKHKWKNQRSNLILNTYENQQKIIFK